MSQNPFAASAYTNNPFVEDPNSAHRRFPTVNALDTSQMSSSAPASQFMPAYFSPTGGPSYGGFQQQYQTPMFTGYQPQQLQVQPTGYYSAPQSPAGQMSPTGYGMASPQLGYGGYGGYGGYHQQQQQQQQYPQMTSYGLPSQLSQFDPLGSLEPQQQQQQQPTQTYAPNGALNTPNYASNPATSPSTQTARAEDHPRAWIRSHRQELESWDPVSWKQALARFDELQSHWERRRQEVQVRVEAAQRGYLPQHEGAAWQQALKDATNNIGELLRHMKSSIGH